jgi:biopolymer transport protein TolQ
MQTLVTCGLLNAPVLASMSFAFSRSNLPGRVIVAFLFLGSILVWSIMVTKIRALWLAQRNANRFLTAYRRERRWPALFGKGRLRRDSPPAEIYVAVCETLASLADAPQPIAPTARGAPAANAGALRTARNTMERIVSEQTLAMEEGMGFLATATTTAPFLGLLGTVWGVMDAFRGMGETALLSAVAPGISGALLTTVVGLLVALPSAIGYNMLGAQIRRLSVQMDQFSRELTSALETETWQDED